METIRIKDEIKLMCVTAESFPDGVKSAFQKLHSVLPTIQGRKFYGVSRPRGNGQIEYRAAVAESFPGEAAEYDCETLTISPGNFACEDIHDYMNNIQMFGIVFSELLKHPELDPNGYCLEMYVNDKLVKCLVPLYQS